MNEDKFDELLKKETMMQADLDLEKQIHHRMNKKIYVRSFKVLVCTVLVVAICITGISQLLDMTNYRPTSENDIVASADQPTAGFDVLVATYLDMYFSGVTCQNSQSYARLGFGNYEITYPLAKVFGPMIAGDGDDLTIKISRSHIKEIVKEGSEPVFRVYEYLDPKSDASCQEQVLQYGDPQDEYADIMNLPDSSILDVALSFPQQKSAEALIDFINKYPDSRFQWVALTTDELKTHGVATGFTLYDSWMEELSAKAREQYPSFYLVDEGLNAQTMVQNYLSKLKLLADHQDFTQMMDAFFLAQSIDYEAKYQDVLANGVLIIGIRGHMTKADLLHMIDEKEVSHITIYDAKLSKYSS